MYPLSFLHLAWAAFPGYDNVYFTFFVPYWAIPLEHWECLFYFLALHASIVHDVCVYIYICLFAGDHALCMMDSHDYESGPLIIMSALDLVVWVCAQGNCCRRIFTLYCVHDYRCVIVSIYVTKWRRFPRVCNTHQYAWHSEGLWLVLAWACWHVLYT